MSFTEKLVCKIGNETPINDWRSSQENMVIRCHIDKLCHKSFLRTKEKLLLNEAKATG